MSKKTLLKPLAKDEPGHPAGRFRLLGQADAVEDFCDLSAINHAR
jgi:hypothetical protein